MKIKLTFGEILNAPRIGSWDRFCKKHDYNVYMINEGLANSEDEIEITTEEAKEYGLIKGNNFYEKL